MLHAAIGTRGKSAEAFRTISEVADGLDVPQHVLRFWEGRFSQIRPVKRAGGRRYYRPEDVDLLRGIRALLYGDGLTIKGVQKILRDHGVRYVADIGRGKASLMGHREKPVAVVVPAAKPAAKVVAKAAKPAKTPKPAKVAAQNPLQAMLFDHVPQGPDDVIDATPVTFEDIGLDPAQFAPIEDCLPPPVITMPQSDGIVRLGPESRARLEIRLVELLELKKQLAEASRPRA
ncbi:MAG TPA: MerR family transcriptional regulator [Rhizomicrobium sp.]|nr:MerR family transcriptional regulator [Rhizomicrobium sp.]